MRMSDWSSDVCSSDLQWFPSADSAPGTERQRRVGKRQGTKAGYDARLFGSVFLPAAMGSQGPLYRFFRDSRLSPFWRGSLPEQDTRSQCWDESRTGTAFIRSPAVGNPTE